MSDPTSGWIDPNPRDTTDPRVNRVLTFAGIGLTLLVIATLVIVVLIQRVGGPDSDSPRSVTLTAANGPVPEPFTPSVVVAPTQISETAAAQIAATTQQLPVAADRGVRLASGTLPGLYGVTGPTNSCDAAAVANHLSADTDKSDAWAGAIGIEPEQIPYYLNTLTPVVLTTDMWLTSHAYTDGSATPFQTVLQAGSAVLIDAVGVPRTHCASGDPLLPPAKENLTRLSRVEGSPWPGYDPQNVVAVAYSAAGPNPPQQAPASAVTEFSLVDLSTAQSVVREAGGTINLGEPVTSRVGPLPDPIDMNRPPAGLSPVIEHPALTQDLPIPIP